MIEEDLAGYPILLKCHFIVHALKLSDTSCSPVKLDDLRTGQTETSVTESRGCSR